MRQAGRAFFLSATQVPTGEAACNRDSGRRWSRWGCACHRPAGGSGHIGLAGTGSWKEDRMLFARLMALLIMVLLFTVPEIMAGEGSD